MAGQGIPKALNVAWWKGDCPGARGQLTQGMVLVFMGPLGVGLSGSKQLTSYDSS